MLHIHHICTLLITCTCIHYIHLIHRIYITYTYTPYIYTAHARFVARVNDFKNMTKQAEDKILQIRDEMSGLRKKVNDIEYKLNVSYIDIFAVYSIAQYSIYVIHMYIL